MSNKPAPCLFCGSEHVELICSGSAWFVQCHGCEASGPTIEDGEQDDTLKALAAWAKPGLQREEEWTGNHDERCDNLHHCTSFGGTDECCYPRPWVKS